MCGVAGYQTSSDTRFGDDVLETMRRHLRHRGPDSHGAFLNGRTGLTMTRLAIMDVDNGAQPLISPSGNVLIANGEIYNAPELRAECADYPFATQSDCEVILPLYERYGLDFLDRLRGMYAIAIYEKSSSRLILARDVFGIKPLYYVERDGIFAFASELSPLLATGFAEPKPDSLAQTELMQLKYVTGNKTIFSEVKRLGAGEAVVVEDARVQRSRATTPWHWRERYRGTPRTGSDMVDAFGRVMGRSVALHLRADVPFCLLYSGGIDSTIIMRMAQKTGASQLSALTIGYSGAEPDDESANACKMASAAGVDCERVEMGAADFWRLAPRIVAAVDDPMADMAVLPLYILGQEAAKRGFKVALSGEGADEIFGGYSRYRRATLPWPFRSRKRRRGVFSADEFAKQRLFSWDEGLDQLEIAQVVAWSSRLQLLQAIDVLERLPNCLLTKLDRALMAHGVEGRTPFLDKEVIAFAACIPDNMRADPWVSKRLLRDWLFNDFPIANPYGKKRGFGVPLASWLHPRSKALAELLAAHPATAPLFTRAEVEQVFENCSQDKQRAWSLLFYALWHSHHILGIDCHGDVETVLRSAANPVRARQKFVSPQ